MNRCQKLSFVYVHILAALLVSYSSFAGSLSYSGRLVNTNGSPVTGMPDLLFELAYTGSTSTIRCTDTLDDVQLTNGVFHVRIDFDCAAAGMSLENVLAQVPAGQAVAIRVTNTTASKVYSFQELHSIPKAKLSDTALQLIPMGANTNEVLTWTGSKWEPKPIASTGSVTSIATGSGLSGGPITTSGTISIANGGVTDTHLAGSISRSKLENGTANAVVVNNGAGVLSDVSQVPVTMGGTGSSTAAGALTNLGIGSMGTLNYGVGWNQILTSGLPTCVGNQKLTITSPPTITLVCVDDDSVWSLNGNNLINSNSGNVGIGTSTPVAKLDVTGEVRVGNTSLACSSSTVGAIRYNSGWIDVCDGTNWSTSSSVGVSPAGLVSAFSRSTCPTGWLEANGSTISRTTYSALFAAIGTTFGAGDGSTTFRLPDLRGEFIRGFDNGRGIDNGRAFGSFQHSTIVAHMFSYGGNFDAQFLDYAYGSPVTRSKYEYTNTASYTAQEYGLRPRNVSMIYCVSTSLNSATTVASVGTGTANYVPQWTSSTGLGNSSIAISGGNVGIGTSTPTAKLEVNGTIKVEGRLSNWTSACVNSNVFSIQSVDASGWNMTAYNFLRDETAKLAIKTYSGLNGSSGYYYTIHPQFMVRDSPPQVYWNLNALPEQNPTASYQVIVTY